MLGLFQFDSTSSPSSRLLLLLRGAAVVVAVVAVVVASTSSSSVSSPRVLVPAFFAVTTPALEEEITHRHFYTLLRSVSSLAPAPQCFHATAGGSQDELVSQEIYVIGY